MIPELPSKERDQLESDLEEVAGALVARWMQKAGYKDHKWRLRAEYGDRVYNIFKRALEHHKPKPLHRMSEAELMDVVSWMEETYHAKTEAQIAGMVDQAVREWSFQRRGWRDKVTPTIFPVLKPGRQHYWDSSENGAWPTDTVPYMSVIVRLPLWLRNEEQARWLADRMIREQIGVA